MLTEIEYSQLCERFQLEEGARRYATVTRTSPPSRSVEAGPMNNTCKTVASNKMELSIDTESKTAEARVALRYEFSDEVFEYWNQPPSVLVERTRKDGTKYKIHYTPDFFVLSTQGVRAVQVKPGKKLAEKLANESGDWKLVDGVPHDLPADAAFAQIGIQHEVINPDEYPPIYYANIGHLLQARESARLATADLLEDIERCFKDQACMVLADLAGRLGMEDFTPFFQLIAERALFARLKIDSLTSPRTAWIAREERFLSAMQLPMPISLAEKASQSAVRIPSESHTAHALQRIERLNGQIAKRTKARYRKLIRIGEAAGKSIFDSLLPAYGACGNRRPRLNPLQVQLINETIESVYKSDRRTDKQNAYRCYVIRSRDRFPEFPIVTPKTFKKYIDRRNPAETGRSRGGRRLANALAEPSPVESRDLPPTRPFERATIDHCQIPIHVVLHDRGRERITRQPWITVMRDVATGCILAFWLSLNDPSCIADAMVIRRCVQTWKRLPEHITTDRGRDFWSLYFRGALAHFSVDHSLNPPGSSRHNSPAERPFGYLRTSWAQYRPGNSANPENARTISATHKPVQTAELNLDEAWSEFVQFTDWFNAYIAEVGGDTPLEKLHAGVRTFSFSGVPVVDNLEFKISTAVDIRRFKLDTKDGLRVNDRRYWCNALATRESGSNKFQVRIDPEDPYVVYALINDAWHQCHANGTEQFSHLTLTERLSHATRVMEGRELRRKVREECQQEFTRTLLEADATREAKKDKSPPPAQEPSPSPNVQSLFDQVRELSVDPPTAEPQEVSVYALDRIRHR